jgi:hypothetical protein
MFTLPISLYGDHYVSYRFNDGRYIDTTSFSVSGLSFAQISIYYADSVHCATITHEVAPSDTGAAVFTTSDLKIHQVKRDGSPSLLQTVLRFLVDRNYL